MRSSMKPALYQDFSHTCWFCFFLIFFFFVSHFTQVLACEAIRARITLKFWKLALVSWLEMYFCKQISMCGKNPDRGRALSTIPWFFFNSLLRVVLKIMLYTLCVYNRVLLCLIKFKDYIGWWELKG